ncbi:MAG TPA: acetolactate synthase small subunit [Chloroflexota bacterium]
MKHTLVALVEDRPGVLSRVITLFRRRNFNIESISVGHTETPDISRMTLVVDGSKTQVEQVTKQLYKVINVRKVSDVTEDATLDRELALIKVSAKATTRSEILQMVEIYRAKVLDVAPSSITIEITGQESKVDSLVGLLKGYGIKEMVRTGKVSMVRGSTATRETTGAPTSNGNGNGKH